MIDVKNLSVTLNGRQVVKDLSFTAQPGALTAIIGPNGSGKTSTLKALSGERRFAGEITLNGRDLRQIAPRELALTRGVMAQAVNLGFPFTVREILEMGVVASDLRDPALANQRMSAALRLVDLEGFDDRVATALSGGEQARLHMARLLCQIAEPVSVNGPNWLLLDEPVASLDIKHQLAIMRLARDFAKRGGGVVAVMHDLNLTAQFADQVVMLRAGQLQQAGAPAEVFTEALLEQVYGCALKVERADGLRVLTPLDAA